MGLYSADPLEGGGGREEGGAVLPSGIPGDPDIWARDVGSDPPHGEDPWGVSPLGGDTTHGADP